MNYYDLAIVGRGPVGLALAALAAQLNLKTVIIERHRDLYALPRAGHVDHEIVRLFQSLGVADAMLADSYPTTEYVWVNQDRELLLEFDWGAKGISGYNSDYMQFQPVFETALGEKVSSAATVSQLLGWEAQSMIENADGVVLTLARSEMVSGQARPIATNEIQTIGARYVVAADGANSGVRRMLGIDRDDFGFNEKWLVVDARKKREFSLDFDCGQICDPRRPVTVLPLGKRHRRWEWALLPGEAAADLEQPKMAWKLLAEQNVFSDDVEIIRQLVYTFEARHAQEWSKGRIFLAGDAAHTTPPFMGQGMCSGLRDAKNLAWKLDLVLRGISEPSILDTYEQERSPHTRDWTIISLEAGKVPCTLDQEEARLRDEKFRSGWMPPMPDFPKLVEGILASPETGSPVYLNGTLSLQAPVLKDGKRALFDEFFPSTRFVVISTVANPASVLSQSRIDALERIGVWFVYVGPEADADIQDIDGAYGTYFRENNIEVLIQRPDFYVFGASEKLSDLGSLADDLLDQLHLVSDVRASARADKQSEERADAY
ncbi:bifunctional 3-(3-hydroxy-phenyl)propionate/3-hydroxycinnamic acid hydroxylase (plasmid) [Rhizobium sp. CC1099]|uniref:bifunctional 3-(3-hydroxy-phenyl)propionate/3-hydroxycinnamic acid hydroxylase n=1 Tax=Rhizobium sp. CC1099 TaxID=3039160 RepID=UPI0024B186BD|nr:bifunctional 3-(3-hydroxy-phenyl)propionate/3-hydroxycinnamic acid hydroxylase [Rhizobium sp. CC1099]WFU91357.1 bifunctional 3-(3-hydroxy-phenyl)propionate/3-hydroxycinnamic acid hydroxylase [Rhizobium sp. CC1099]